LPGSPRRARLTAVLGPRPRLPPVMMAIQTETAKPPRFFPGSSVVAVIFRKDCGGEAERMTATKELARLLAGDGGGKASSRDSADGGMLAPLGGGHDVRSAHSPVRTKWSADALQHDVRREVGSNWG
jgi:hypothetical protein